MKKRLLLLVLIAAAAVTLSGFCFLHDWQDATCDVPKTCAKCNKTRGESLGHDWAAATCDVPETCARCGVTQGEPLAHSWQGATCAAPETCILCGVTQGDSLPHAPDTGKGTVQCRWEEGSFGPEGGLAAPCGNCGEECWIPAENLLTGNWGAEKYVRGEQEMVVDHFYTFSEFYADNTFYLVENETPLFGIWTYSGTEPREALPDAASYQARQEAGEPVYGDATFRLTFHSGIVMEITVQAENADACVLLIGDLECHFSRNRMVSPDEVLAAKELAGTWELRALISKEHRVYKPAMSGISGRLECQENGEIRCKLKSLLTDYDERGRWCYTGVADDPLNADKEMHRYGVMLDSSYIMAVGVAQTPQLDDNLQPGAYCVLVTSGDQYYFQRVE